MVNLPVIAKRELNTYFLSPIAYLVLTGFAVVHGLLFIVILGGGQIDPNHTVGGTLWVGLYLMILAAPIITMRLLSEESSSGTMETLMTTPVGDLEVVLGKFMGALVFGMAMLIPLLVEAGFLMLVGQVDYGPLASGLLGIYLLTAQFLAIGLFCSSLTRAQIGSAILSFVILLGLFFIWLVARDRTSQVADTLKYLAPPMHFAGFVKGVVDTRDLVYFVASTGLFLWLTLIVLQFRRWWGSGAQGGKVRAWQSFARTALPYAIALLVALLIGATAAGEFAEKSKIIEVLAAVLKYASLALAAALLIYLVAEIVTDILSERKARLRANLAIIGLLALALTSLVCYISTRRFARVDMTGKLRYSLHSKTQRMLRSLESPVSVTVLSPGMLPGMEGWAMEQARDLLEEFKSLTGDVTVGEIDLNNDRDLPRVKDLQARIGPDIPAACIIFEYEGRNEIVRFEELYEMPPPYSGMAPRFKGEAAFATALAKLMRREQQVIYFLTGHGERVLEGEPQMPGSTRSVGLLNTERFSLSRLVQKIEADNFEVRSLNLSEQNKVPADCDVLIIPGPRTPFSEAHLNAVRDYLAADGRMIVMLDSQLLDPEATHNLNPLLMEYGIVAHADAVAMAPAGAFDMSTSKFVRVANDQVGITQNGYAYHSVTSDLQNYEVVFIACCPLEILNPMPRPGVSVRALLTTPSGTWGERKRWKSEDDMMESRFDPATDVAGPVVAAVVVEPAPPPGMPFMGDPAGLPGPRIIVLGSSFSFITQMAQQSLPNLYLVMNAVNWMAGKDFMVGIPPKDVDVNIVTLSEGQRRGAFWLFVIGLPVCIIVLGTAVWQIRRR